MKDTKLSNLFKAAETEKKGDYLIYGSYKNQLDNMNLSSEEYEKAVKKLCNILRV